MKKRLTDFHGQPISRFEILEDGKIVKAYDALDRAEFTVKLFQKRLNDEDQSKRHGYNRVPLYE